MAEVAGLALGVASLASLFSTCVELFDMLQMCRASQRDIAILHQRLDNQKMRFVVWGTSLGLDNADPNPEAPANNLLNPAVQTNVVNTMKHIVSLLNDGDQLQVKYGLRRATDQSMVSTRSSSKGNAFSAALHRFRAKLRSMDSAKSGSRALRWVMSDRRQYQELVENLKNFVDDLESMTQSQSQAEKRNQIIEYEIEELPEEDLEIVVEAASDAGEDALSDAASCRIERLSIASSRPASIFSLEDGPYLSARASISEFPSELPADTSYLSPDASLTRSGYMPRRLSRKAVRTGCLTCRKRRIKCDENRPSCTNCTVSKRPCHYTQRSSLKDLPALGETISDDFSTRYTSTEWSDIRRNSFSRQNHSPGSDYEIMQTPQTAYDAHNFNSLADATLDVLRFDDTSSSRANAVISSSSQAAYADVDGQARNTDSGDTNFPLAAPHRRFSIPSIDYTEDTAHSIEQRGIDPDYEVRNTMDEASLMYAANASATVSSDKATEMSIYASGLPPGWSLGRAPGEVTEGGTVLQILACADRFAPELQSRLKNTEVDVNFTPTENLFPPLMLAIKARAWENFRSLVNHPRIDVNKTDPNGRTPYMIAAEEGNSLAISTLESIRYCKRYQRDNQGKTAVEYALATRHYPVAVRVMDGSEPAKQFHSDSLLTCLWYASEHAILADHQHLRKSIEVWLRFDEEQQHAVQSTSNRAARKLGEIFNHAASVGAFHMVEACLQYEQLDPNIVTNSSRRTALHHAAEAGFMNIVQALLNKFSGKIAVDANAIDDNGWTPLSLAASHGHVEIVEFLMLHPLVDRHSTGKRSTTAFQVALEGYRRSDAWKSMLEIDPTVAQTYGSFGPTPLMLAVQSGREDILKSVLVHGCVDAHDKDDSLTSALNSAIRADSQTAVHWILIHSDVSLESTSLSDDAPLFVAVERNNQYIVERLINHSEAIVLRPSNEGLIPIIEAVILGHRAIANIIARTLTAAQKTQIAEFRSSPIYRSLDADEIKSVFDAEYVLDSVLKRG